LLQRIRDPRDSASWNSFVEVYGPLVYRHCRRRGLQHSDAEDVTQEVFARVNQAIRTFAYRPETGRFRDWLGTITVNEVKRFLKKESGAVRSPGTSEPQDALATVQAPEQETSWTEEFCKHVLATALARCRPHFEEATWQAFERTWLQRQPAPAVAGQLNLPIDRVYVAKSRVLDRLQREVRDLVDDADLLVR
jgi:RNA polymerase sigma-70 factor (ECF subfamily)